MLTKYYTQFLLRTAEAAEADEYSGVVEVRHRQGQVLDADEIETLLAQNFEIEVDNVELLNWSRLH